MLLNTFHNIFYFMINICRTNYAPNKRREQYIKAGMYEWSFSNPVRITTFKNLPWKVFFIWKAVTYVNCLSWVLNIISRWVIGSNTITSKHETMDFREQLSVISVFLMFKYRNEGLIEYCWATNNYNFNSNPLQTYIYTYPKILQTYASINIIIIMIEHKPTKTK